MTAPLRAGQEDPDVAPQADVPQADAQAGIARASAPRSRRAILSAGLAALAALATQALTRPGLVAAHDPDDVWLGATNITSSETSILDQATTNQENGLSVQKSGGAAAIYGVGSTGVVGLGGGAAGVRGLGEANSATTGVSGEALGTGNSIQGDKNTATGHAVVGNQNAPSSTWAAVAGVTQGSGPGVYGRGDATGNGVHGETYAPAGAGVYGQALTTTGYAIRGNGRVRLDKASGLATLAAGTTSKTITPGTDISTGSFVLLTPMADLGGRRLWFTRDTTNNRFTIRMSSSRTSSTSIAWLLLG